MVIFISIHVIFHRDNCISSLKMFIVSARNLAREALTKLHRSLGNCFARLALQQSSASNR